MPPNGRIDQAGGAGSGVAGDAREGLWLSTAISLVDVGAGSPVSRLWTLLDRPPGSAAVIVNPTQVTATLTPDLPGSYLWQLQWDGDKKQIFERVMRVTLDNAGAALKVLPPLPAAGEERQHSNGIVGQGVTGRGWAPLHDALRKRAGLQVLAYAASLTIDLSLGQTVRVAALTGNLTLNAPSLPVDGEPLTIETVQDATGGRVITWNAVFEFADGLAYNDRRPSIRSVHVFRYSSTAAKFVCIARVLVTPLHVSVTTAAQVMTPDKINVLSAAASTATLPLASAWAHQTITVKLSGLASCVVSRSGADTIDGATTYTITSGPQNAGTVSFSSDGTNIFAYPGA